MASEYAISTISSLLAALLSFSTELFKLTLSLAIHLIKHLAAAIVELHSYLDEVLPPGRRIETIHHYLIAKRDEWKPVMMEYSSQLLAKINRIYPPTKQFILIKSEELIRFLEACSEHLINKFDCAFPPGERIEALCHYIEAAKQYMAVKSEDWTADLKRFVRFLAQNIEEAFLAEEKEVALRRWWQMAKPWVVACAVAWMSFHCIRICFCGQSKTMKAPGRGGARIRRGEFERNPKDYFKKLHSSK